MRSTRRRILASLAIAAALAGCGGDAAEEAAGETPQRIIALAPSVAEAMHVLGLADRVVGVGDYVTWPPELASKRRLGGLFNPDFEGIVALDPDLAILLTSEESLRGRLEAIGIDVLMVPSDTLGDVELAIQTIGERCGVEEKAREVLREWRLALRPDPVSGPLRAVLVVGREPRRLGDMVVAGPDTFFDQLLGRLGAINVFYDVSSRYPQVGVEEVIRRRPDVVLELQPLVVPDTRRDALLADWRGLDALDDAPGPCVQIVDGEHVLVPGPRLPQIFGELRAALQACVPREAESEGESESGPA